jgi:hypothetical protein
MYRICQILEIFQRQRAAKQSALIGMAAMNFEKIALFRISTPSVITFMAITDPW